MPSSIYVRYKTTQVQAPPSNEGEIYPLLRRDESDNTKLTWAYAVPKSDPHGADLAARRKNELVCATLIALSFQLDGQNSASTLPYDFFYLPADTLIDSIDAAVFSNLPVLSSTNAFDVLDPVGGDLTLGSGGTLTLTMHQGTYFGVKFYKIESGQFIIGTGEPTLHQVVCKLDMMQLPGDIGSGFSAAFSPDLTFDQTAGSSDSNQAVVLTCNTLPIVANNQSGDIRHDRLTTTGATLVRLYPTFIAAPALAVEVFPALAFQPTFGPTELPVPVTVTIQQEGGVCVRLMSRTDSVPKPDPELRLNPAKPCFRIVVTGPTVHGDVTGIGALEACQLLEPVERQFHDSVEQLNEYLTYGFEVCLPDGRLSDLTLADFVRLEQISAKIPNFQIDIGELAAFLKKLGGYLYLPNVTLATSFEIDFSVFSLGLTFDELRAQLKLPDIIDIAGWKEILKFRADLPLRTDLPLLTSLDILSIAPPVGLKLQFTLHQVPQFTVGNLELVPFDLLRDLFDFRFPKATVPAFNQFELSATFADPTMTLTVTLPSGLLTAAMLPTVPELWTLVLKRPDQPSIALDGLLSVSTIAFPDVKFTLPERYRVILGAPQLSLQLHWSFEIDHLSLSSPNITISEPALPTALFPGFGGESFDVRLFKVRLIQGNIDLGAFAFTINEDLTLKLDIPEIDGTFPTILLFAKTNVRVEIALDVSFNLSRCSLKDLLGDVPGMVDFRLSVPRLTKVPDLLNLTLPEADLVPLPRFGIAEIMEKFRSLATPIIPLELTVPIPRPDAEAPDWHELTLAIGFRFDLSKMRLFDNRIYFFLPALRSNDPDLDLAPRQAIDCEIFTMTFPNRRLSATVPTIDDHDGYFDLSAREFVIDLKYPATDKPTPTPRIRIHFPGGLDQKAACLGREVVEAKLKSGATDSDYGKLEDEFAKRFELELDSIDPQMWPNAGPQSLMFRLNSNGLTLAANLSKTEVMVDSGQGSTDASGLIKPFKLNPQQKQGELKSRIVCIDNNLKEAIVYAKTEVPGVDGLIAELSVGLRQLKKGTLPDVIASMELERSDHTPLAEFSIKYLQMSLERIAMGLTWHRAERTWDYSVLVDGTISFTGAADLVPDLEDLRAPSIQVVGLDLRRMNLRALRMPVVLVRPIRFDILDGQFGVELGDFEIAWEFDGKIPRPRELVCKLAKFEFKNPGALEVSIEVGGLTLEFNDDLSVHVKLPPSLGIEVALGPTAKFAGQVGWIETKTERYLFATGKTTLQGFPEIRGLLKFGTGKKLNGRREINVVLYGEAELDEPLFPGAVAKSLGVGVGLNNRIAAFGPRPSSDEIIERIDQVSPGKITGWKFVEEGGFYLSVVGSAILASNQGDEKVLNTYVANLVVSIDSNFDLVAAGKFWLACSLKGVRDHFDNPAFVGAMVLSPSQRSLEIALRSKKNAFVEDNPLIQRLLDKGDVRFSFRMTPNLVDFHLEELEYVDTMFGIQMQYHGEYRFAIFKRAVLLKSEVTATGVLVRGQTAGPGGFDLNGRAQFGIGYGGMLSDKGSMAYAFLDASLTFDVSAWIEIGFSLSFTICRRHFTKTWSITFRARAPKLELSFRGNIAAADFGGLASVDVQIGINICICGYALRASGRMAINPDLYQEVRSRVAAFESELDAAIQTLSSDQTNALTAPANERRLDPVTDQPEKWLLYRRSDVQHAIMAMPAPGTPWLTPTLASLGEIVVADSGGAKTLTFTVDDPESRLASLPAQTKIRLLGLPRNSDGLDPLNGAWPLKSVPVAADHRTTFELDLSALSTLPTPKTYRVRSGIWYVQQAITPKGAPTPLPSTAQDTVHYLNHVERVVMQTSPWFDIDFVNGLSLKVTGQFDPSFQSSRRVILRASHNQEIQDVHAVPTFDQNDVADVSVRISGGGDAGTNAIEIEDAGIHPSIGWQIASAIEIAPTWSDRNRLAAVRDGSTTADVYDALTKGASFWPESALRDGVLLTTPPPLSFASVFDERYASADPRYTVDDVPPYPGVLSTRFRSIDDVEIVGADMVLSAARRYQDASRSLARQELHGALDLLDGEALAQARAQASNLLAHRFSDPAGIDSTEDEYPEARVVDFVKEKIAYGWILNETDKDLKVFGLHVRRAGSTAKASGPLAAPEDVSQALGRISTLPIRQEFVIDQASETLELGRVLVKLPIRIPDNLLRGDLGFVGRFQIHRRIGSGPFAPIADHLRPEISVLSKPQVFSRGSQLFVEGERKFVGSGDYGFGATAVVAVDGKTKLNVDGPDAALLPEFATGLLCFTEHQASPFVVAERVGDSITIDGADLPADGTRVEFELHSDALVLQRAVLFSDEFAVENREFKDSELRSATAFGTPPIAHYRLQVLTEDDPGGTAATRNAPILWDVPVPLFVLPRVAAPPSLALAVSVQSLIAQGTFEFQLVELSGETPTLALRDDQLLDPESFELGFDQKQLKQTGYFGGDQLESAVSSDPDGAKLTLDAVTVAQSLESDIGKIVVSAEQLTGIPRYKLADSPLIVGRSHRAFLRFKETSGNPAFRRLPVLLVRDLPVTWDSSVRFRNVDTLESIPADHLANIMQTTPVVRDFSADDAYAAGRSAIRAVWPSLSLLEGGVELQFRDFDDSSFRARTLVEVLGSEEFSVSQQDFRNEEFWIRRPSDRVERYATQLQVTPKPADAALSKLIKTAYSYLATSLARLQLTPSVREATEPTTLDATKLLSAARDKFKSGTWEDTIASVRFVQTALLAFEKSPLNLNDVDINEKIERIRACLRAAIVGAQVVEPADFFTYVLQAMPNLINIVNRIEQQRPEPFQNPDVAATAVLDRATARKLCGIVRRRVAIADEIFSLQSVDDIPDAKDVDRNHPAAFAPDPLLARQGACDMATDDAVETIVSIVDGFENANPTDLDVRTRALAQLPDTATLNDLVTTSGAQAAVDAAIGTTLTLGVLGELINAIEDTRYDQYVLRAAGLQTLIQAMEDVVANGDPNSLAAVLKRPHHELAITKDDKGQIIPKPVALGSFFSASGKTLDPLDKGLDRLNLRVGQVALVDGAAGAERVTIWTTCGASIHTTPMQRIQQFQMPGVRRVELFEDAGEPRILAVFDDGWQLGDMATGELIGEKNTLNETQATIAKTPRGVEVIVIAADQTQILLFAAESPDRQISFGVTRSKTSDPDPVFSPVAYFEEAKVVAAANGANVNYWRDLGRDNASQYTASFSAAVLDVMPILLPDGPYFVVVTAQDVSMLKLFDDESPTSIAVGGTIKFAAIDRRELLAVVRIASGEFQVFDLRNFVAIDTHVAPFAGAGLAMLHGRRQDEDESYLVLPKDDGSTAILLLASASPDSPAIGTLIHTLNCAKEFVTPGTSVVACASALMNARSSRADQNIVQLFHLWERMGFAVDIAVQDAKTSLMTFEELREQIDLAVLQMPLGSDPQRTTINGGVHYIYVVEGEEPDAEFQPLARVGFAHAKIAVVPEEFLIDSLLGDSATLTEWFDARSVTFNADAGQKTTIELDYVAHLTRLVGVPTNDRIGVCAEVANPRLPRELPDAAVVRMQPRSQRFVRVPMSGGVTHWTWTLPDVKGHRIMAAARSVSRYEPLLRWWLNVHTRFDLPEEAPLADADFVVKSVDAKSVTIDVPLSRLTQTGWQTARLEIVSGVGAGQQRELVSIGDSTPSGGSTLTFDEEDPFIPAPDATSKVRIMDAAAGWRMVAIDPIHDPVVGDGPRSLVTYQYPHSRYPRFSYQIPLDGMRSTYNQISRVRTGYHGVELAFRYFVPTTSESGAPSTLKDLLKETSKTADPLTSAPARTTTTVRRPPESTIELFGGERLLTLPELPFFYHYRLDVRSAYVSRMLESDRAGPADLLPSDLNLSPAASRRPTCLGLNDASIRLATFSGTFSPNQPTDDAVAVVGGPPLIFVEKVTTLTLSGGETRVISTWDAGGTLTLTVPFTVKPNAGESFTCQSPQSPHDPLLQWYEFGLFVSTNRDHLSREELVADANLRPDAGGDTRYVAPIELMDNPPAIPPADLPDFSMAYDLLALQVFDADSDIPHQIHSYSGAITLPWHATFPTPTRADPTKPFVKLPTNLIGGAVGSNAPSVGAPPLGPEFSVVLERMMHGSRSYWRLRFWVRQAPGQPALDASRFYVQGKRDGNMTRAAPVKQI